MSKDGRSEIGMMGGRIKNRKELKIEIIIILFAFLPLILDGLIKGY